MTSASDLPEKFGIQVVPHKRFERMFACRIHVPFEGRFWLVDDKKLLEVFDSHDEAMAAGARALLPILNHRIAVPGPGWRSAPELCSRSLARHGEKGVEMGFFAWLTG